tara:strand:- start:906 stop:1256 length:351 start_codon:yes stop_codon:yes gene_type:complete
MIELVVIPKITASGVIVNGPEHVVGEDGKESLLAFTINSRRSTPSMLKAWISFPESIVVWFGSNMLGCGENFSSSSSISTLFYLPTLSAKIISFWVRFPPGFKHQSALRVGFDDAS